MQIFLSLISESETHTMRVRKVPGLQLRKNIIQTQTANDNQFIPISVGQMINQHVYKKTLWRLLCSF